MKTKTLMIAAAALVALGIPAIASAQTWGGYWNNGYQGGYGAPRDYGYRGDYEGPRDGRNFPGYPEFRGEEQHIRGEIIDAMRQGLIGRDQAGDLFGDLHRIQFREAREFDHHGWWLPDNDRRSIRGQLDRLDRRVDGVRFEP